MFSQHLNICQADIFLYLWSQIICQRYINVVNVNQKKRCCKFTSNTLMTSISADKELITF